MNHLMNHRVRTDKILHRPDLGVGNYVTLIYEYVNGVLVTQSITALFIFPEGTE